MKGISERVGERIEIMIEKYKNNSADIEGKGELLYTERRDGVVAGYNIRTDRFEVALDAADKIESSYQSKREERLKIVKDDTAEPKGTEGTNNE